MNQSLKACLLAIGTEITTGQITNTNATWLSQQLYKLGIEPVIHMSIPDDRTLILESLQQLSKKGDFLFVTGGLGPTIDDFTRDIIAQWTTKPMVWNESAWQHIQQRLSQKGLVAKEIQKQQCYFPEGANILENQKGTAHGFQMTVEQVQLFVLPGPPIEMQYLWENWIHLPLSEIAAKSNQMMTRSWDTQGLPESLLAEKVNPALEGCPLTQAYRVHLPFVEFKLSFLKSQSAEAQKWIAAIDNVLLPWTVLKDGLPQKPEA